MDTIVPEPSDSKTPETPREQALDALAEVISVAALPTDDYRSWREIAAIVVAHLRTHPRRVAALDIGDRAQAFADVEHSLLRNAEAWEEDGGDPCRIRVTRDIAETVRAWAAGAASPSGPAAAWRSGHPQSVGGGTA